MISLELINQYILALTEQPNLSKAKRLELFELLNEFHSIYSEVKQIQGKLIQLADDKKINRYIELDDNKVYCLHNNKVYNAIPINHADFTELIELEKEISDSQDKLRDYIDAGENRISELYQLLDEKLERVTSTTKSQKAIDSDGFVFVNKDNNFYYTIDN
jgi:hypothetical protein